MFGEMIQFDLCIFFRWVGEKPPTSNLWCIHLHLVDVYGKLVGKYTSSMDPKAISVGFIQPTFHWNRGERTLRSQDSYGYHSLCPKKNDANKKNITLKKFGQQKNLLHFFLSE